MAVKWRTKRDGFPKMTRTLEQVDGEGIEVGVLGGEQAWLASIHEYGCDIPVTPKMRAYLHHKGLHLSPNTTHIHIPERSFLRTGYDKNMDEVTKKAAAVIVAAAEGQMSTKAALEIVGGTLRDRIRDYARDLNNPANHPFTVDQKGSSNPLVDTGDMIGSIEWRKAK